MARALILIVVLCLYRVANTINKANCFFWRYIDYKIKYLLKIIGKRKKNLFSDNLRNIAQ